MSANVYDIGDLVRVSAVFKNTLAVATDPTTVSCKVRQPNGTVTTLVYGVNNELVKDSTGNYHTDISVTARGIWMHKFIGTGSVQATEEKTFLVKSSLIE